MATKEAFHPLEYIREELQTRGWTEAEFARRVALYDYGIAHLATEMFFAVGEDPNCRMGNLAGSFAAVFGVSPEFFQNLEAAWLEAVVKRGN